MRLDQFDVARLTDDEIRSLVLALEDRAGDRPGGLPDYWRTEAAALRRVLADRRRMFAVAVLDVEEDEAEGSLVEPGTDPVADAQAQLRQGPPEWPVQ